MRQYTTPEQTAKLIELGFEKPKGWCADGISSRLIMYKHKEDDEGFNYSIGELIEMLPKNISHPRNTSLNFYLAISFLQSQQWYVDYETCDSALCSVAKSELIDALYDMIVKLKEKGVI